MYDLFPTQRAMREKRSTALQRGVIGVLDVGTTQISCAILKFEKGLETLVPENAVPLSAQSGFRIIGASTKQTQGVQNGEIISAFQAETVMRNVIQSAEKMAHQRIDEIVVTLSGLTPHSTTLFGKIALEEGVVKDEDIGRVLADCDIYADPARSIIHAQPVSFTLDERRDLPDPRGQIGRELSTIVHCVTADQAMVHNLKRCIERCDVHLAGIALAPYAAGLSALTEPEQKLGAACIDMGGGTTGISVFWNNHMIFADTIPMGGDTITSDIATGLKIPFAQAERMKTLHGGTLATSMDDRQIIELCTPDVLESGDWDYDRRKVSRTEVIGIIRPRLSQILEEVRNRLEKMAFDTMPSQQIVLTGGGSQLQGLDNLAAQILGQHMRLGRPIQVRGMPQSTKGAGFASAIGLAIHAASPQDECWDFVDPALQSNLKSIPGLIKWFHRHLKKQNAGGGY